MHSLPSLLLPISGPPPLLAPLAPQPPSMEPWFTLYPTWSLPFFSGPRGLGPVSRQPPARSPHDVGGLLPLGLEEASGWMAGEEGLGDLAIQGPPAHDLLEITPVCTKLSP